MSIFLLTLLFNVHQSWNRAHAFLLLLAHPPLSPSWLGSITSVLWLQSYTTLWPLNRSWLWLQCWGSASSGFYHSPERFEQYRTQKAGNGQTGEDVLNKFTVKWGLQKSLSTTKHLKALTHAAINHLTKQMDCLFKSCKWANKRYEKPNCRVAISGVWFTQPQEKTFNDVFKWNFYI